MAGLGDFDANGFDDIAVSGPWAAHLGVFAFDFDPNETAFVDIIFGPNLGYSERKTALDGLTLPLDPDDPQPRGFGLSLANVGDVDGDNLPDLLVGCPHYSVDGNVQRAVYAYSGVPAFFTRDTFAFGQPLTLTTDGTAYLDDFSLFGWSLYEAGNYDFLTGASSPRDFVVGSPVTGNPSAFPCADPSLEQGGRQTGRAFVIEVTAGDPDILSAVIVQCLYLGEPGAEGGRSRLGTAVAVGDFDGDTAPDIATGGSGYTALGSGMASEGGRVYLFTNAEVP